MASVTCPPGSSLWKLLTQHPMVTKLEAGDSFTFDSVGGWRRTVSEGAYHAEVFGLVELIDNNPMICADEVSVPSPASTLSLIALGPISQAGLIQGEVVVHINVLPTEEEFLSALASIGCSAPITVGVDEVDLEGVYACSAIIPVSDEMTLSDVEDIFHEVYDRTFYVRRATEWHVKEVLGHPWAAYSLHLGEGNEGETLLTVRVMADKSGKCGAAQMIHAFNVMAGYEESTGIPEQF